MKLYLIFILIYIIPSNSPAQWSNLDGGANAQVRDFYSDSLNELIVVGDFTQIGGQNINNIAVWNGFNWNSFGNNSSLGSFGQILSVVKYNNQIVIGGSFDSINNVRVNNIAKWNGSTWEAMGNGFDDIVSALFVYKGDLYAGGYFNNSGSNTIRAIGKWSGAGWDTIGNFIGIVTSLEEFQGNLIIAGVFHPQLFAGDNIISFDGSSFNTTISNIGSTVLNIRNINDTLYACGSFTSIPGNPSNYLSAYYNNVWHPMPIPSGSNNTITDIIEFRGKKYICGFFSSPPDIGVFNGIGYDSLFNANGFISGFYIFNNQLYMAGQFFQAIAGENYYCIISYNDVSNHISDNLVYKNDLMFISTPSYGMIEMQISNNKFFQIEIYNNKGVNVFTNLIFNSMKVHLPPGTYFVKITDSFNNKSVKKIIVL